MRDASRRARVAAVLQMLAANGRKPTDEQVAAIAAATASLPVRWHVEACRYVGQTWDEVRAPGARAVLRAAYQLAGFRPRRGRVDHFDPTPSTVRWWPMPGTRVPDALAESWSFAPATLGLPAGSFFEVPDRLRGSPITLALSLTPRLREAAALLPPPEDSDAHTGEPRAPGGALEGKP